MRKIYYLFFFLVFISRGNLIFPQTPKGGSSGESITPQVIDPMMLPVPSFINMVSKPAQVVIHPESELIKKMRNIDLPVIPNDKSIIRVKSIEEASGNALKGAASPTAAPIYEWKRGTGPTQQNLFPPDPSLAVGPAHVVIVTNAQVHIYNSRDFSLISSNTLNNWFSRPSAFIYDPKIVYDPWGSRWIILALEKSNTESYYCLSVSQTADPTGRWWAYRLRADVDGSNSTTNWADYPGLGFTYPIGGTGNSGCIAITTNQYNRSNPARYQYGKVRLLRTSQLYIGAGYINWYDFWDLPFTIQPARQLSSTTNGNLYLLNTSSGGGSSVHLSRIDNPTSNNPSFHDQANIGVTSYSVPPLARVAGGLGVVDAFSCRTQDVWFLSNHIYTAWTSAYNWGSGNKAIVHFARINVANNSLAQELRFGADGEWFMQPSACPQFKSPFNNGWAAISFTRTSATLYPQACVIGFDAANPSSFITMNSSGYLGRGGSVVDTSRWGDYSGVAPDPAQNGVFWGVSELANTRTWGTGIFKFGFSPKPTITLSTPNGGENLNIGSSLNIIWTSTNLNNIKIEFSTNNGANWSVLTPYTSAAPGFFNWTVPNNISTQCKIRISDAEGTDAADESDRVFSIRQPPSLTLLSPNGGEIWRVGEQRTIRWNSVSVGNISIDYSTNGGLWWQPINSNFSASAGSITWTIPNTPSTRCHVRIYDVANQLTIYDQSNYVFTISSDPYLAILTPNGGEKWSVGSVHNITWDKGGSSLVNLSYSVNGGKYWQTFANNIAASPSVYPWTIPNEPSDICLVKITEASNPNSMDQSNSVFSIIANPFIVVLSPNGGEKWFAGQKQLISWRSEGVKTVKIELSSDGGNFWSTVTESVAASDESITVTTPNTPGGKCKIRISSTLDSKIIDESDFSFIITGDSPLALINPNPIGFIIGQGNQSNSRFILGNAGLSALTYKIRTSYLNGAAASEAQNTIRKIKTKSLEAVAVPNGNKNSTTVILPKQNGFIKSERPVNSIKNSNGVKYSRKAIVLKSWGDNPVWNAITTDWASYGTMAIEVDNYNYIDVPTFTLQDLINSGADVVILSDPAGKYKQFSREEVDALIAYAEMGHNIIGTCALFQYYWVDNRALAPLFGLNAWAQYSLNDFSPEFNYMVPGEQLFHNINSPYISAGLNYSQYPSSRWDTSYFEGANFAALSSDRKGAITLFNTDAFTAIYISHMPEYNGSIDDAQLLYNAIAYTNVSRGWLAAYPSSGEVTPSSSAEINFEANTANLPQGEYSANIVITTDDPNNTSVLIPVTLNVAQPSKPAPVNLVAGNGFSKMIPLTWNQPDGAYDGIVNNSAGKKTVAGLISGSTKRQLTITDTVAFYRVYFSQTSGGPYVLLADSSIHLRQYADHQDYVDASVDSIQSRFFVVTAVYNDGTESPYSNEAFATTSFEGQKMFVNYLSAKPVIDGFINETEWSDASIFDIKTSSQQAPVNLYIKYNDSTLYAAIDDPNNITSGDWDAVNIYTDLNNDNTWPAAANDYEGLYATTLFSGSIENYCSNYFGNYPESVNDNGYHTYDARMQAMGDYSSGHFRYEAAIKLPNLTNNKLNSIKSLIGQTIGLFVSYSDFTKSNDIYYGGAGYFPYGAVALAPSTYGKFVLGYPAANNIKIKIDSVFSAVGDTVLVAVNAFNLNNAGAITLRINFDKTKLDYVGTVNLNSKIGDALTGQSNGAISIIWDGTTGANLANDKIVDLKFYNKGSASATPVTFLVNECEITDTYLNQLNVAYENGAVLPGLTISGKVNYNNSINIPLAGVKLYLKNASGLTIDSTTSNNTGSYIFKEKSNGSYSILSSVNLLWGGVNATDALAIRKYLVGTLPLTGLNLTCADVNGDGVVSSIDALLIKNRLIFQINSFPVGDWVFDNPVISLSGVSILQNLNALCTGDVNGSYIPPVGKIKGAIVYNNDEIIKIDAAKEFLLPVEFNRNISANAMSLLFNYPEAALEFKGIKGKFEGALSSVSDGNISIVWEDVNPLVIKTNEPVVYLKFKFKDGVKFDKPIYIGLDPQSELAGLDGNAIENLVAKIPTIGLNLPEKYELSQNYPNPFNPVTNIKYSLPLESDVSLIVYNTLGQQVARIVSNVHQVAGYHNVQFNAANLSSGVYFYSLSARSLDGTKNYSAVKKLILIK